jgi:protoheme IX farnesyltransferase
MTSLAQPLGTSITVRELFSLLKPRVMTLVVFTGMVGMMLAPGYNSVHPFIALLIVATIALGSGAGGMLNMWYDRDIDCIMKRTQRRPIPSGKIAADDVLMGGVMLSVAAVMLLGMATNWVAAGWLAFAIFFYSVIYTIGLKRRTPQNIVIGGAAGAFPPVIGWAAVTGNTPLEAWLLFAIIFLWTPPHFWALALGCNEDYRRANIPMLPVSHGASRTVKEMLLYSLLLAAVSLCPAFIGMSGMLYLGGASVFSLLFVILCWRVYQQPEHTTSAKRLFAFSILYLFGIFALLLSDHLIST